MGIMDNLKRVMKPYEEDGFEDYETPAKSATDWTSESAEPGLAEKRSNKVVNIHATAQLQVALVKPERYESAREIADHLRDKRTVVLNLESTDKNVSVRILDFVSGVAYAQEGKIKRVAVSTYIITPYNVDILCDLVDELESNGLYF